MSIGTVRSQLRGHKLYAGTVATRSGEAWYQLDKAGGSTATVRVEATAVDGSTACTGLQVDLDNDQGTGDVITQSSLGDNSAVSLPVTTAGLYYLELTAYGCTPTTATTFSIEPEPGSAWTAAAPPAAGTVSAGTSMATVAAPLLGDTRYAGTAATSSGEAWYQLDKAGGTTANVRIEDTAVDGSTACTGLQVDLDNDQGSGGVITQSSLGDNSAISLPVTTAGVYYLEVTAYGCTPTTATSFSIEPESSSAWSASGP